MSRPDPDSKSQAGMKYLSPARLPGTSVHCHLTNIFWPLAAVLTSEGAIEPPGGG